MKASTLDEDLGYVPGAAGSDLDLVLVHNLLRTQSHLGPFLDAGLRDQNLTATQFNALLVLRPAGDEGLLMRQIGQRLVVTKSNVTGLIDRLERQHLVERCPHSDRRATLVRLTDAGRKAIEQTIPQYTRLARELTSCLSTSEKRSLAKLLAKLRRELRRRRKEAE